MATAAEVEFWKDMCRKESARNNKLRSERNEAIRQQLTADDARKTAEAVANGLEWQVEELEAENAKLRELVHWMYDRMDESCAVQHPYAPAPISYDRLMQALARARELGVEVEP